MHAYVATASYVLGTVLLVLWAIHRSIGPGQNQYVQSDWLLAARFIYVLTYLVIFVGLTGLLVFSGKIGEAIVADLVESFETLKRIETIFAGNAVHVAGDASQIAGTISPLAPLYALAAIYLGLKVDAVKQFDRRVLDWLHSTEHLEEEMRKVAVKLETSLYDPSEVEQAENRRKLQFHDIQVTDNKIISGDIEVVTLWRKVACLLRLTESWKKSSIGVLNPRDEQRLQDIHDADTRKIRHARDIFRALRLSSKQDSTFETSAESTAIETGDRFPDPDVNDDDTPTGEKESLAIGSDELEISITKIQHYFLSEYSILLQRISTLAAKAIVYSGDDAENRWQSVKDAGFEDLGEMNRLNIDSVIKFFCGTLVIILAISWVMMPLFNGSGPSSAGVLKAGLFMGFGILCGAMIASNRNLAKRPRTPWAAFAGAGVMSLFLFLLIHFSFALTETVTSAFERVAADGPEMLPAKPTFGRILFPDGTARELEFRDIFPWVLMPVVAAVAICRISRIRWPNRIGEVRARLLDGCVLATTFLVAMVVTLALHRHLGTAVADMLHARHPNQLVASLLPVALLTVIGFAIGCTVITDVRKIAQSEI